MNDFLKLGIIICCIACIITTITVISFHNDKKHTGREEILDVIKSIKNIQEPLKVIKKADSVYKYYEDICLVFKGSGAYVRAEITGDKYKLNDGIKVGSEKYFVEQTYAKKCKIKDLPDNQFGFIEGADWYCFCYDENDKVEKILIYSVGP